MSRRARLLANAFGRRAEWLALIWLALHGWRILARNYSAPGGEIDLVAARGDTIAFVEVKARPELDAARAAISAQKRRRIARAASAWRARNRWANGYAMRADAIFLGRGGFPRHVANVFDLEFD